MLCKKCGRLCVGHTCLHCGNHIGEITGSIETSREIEHADICLNCGKLLVNKNIEYCPECGTPRGFTSQQTKYAAYKENVFEPFAILMTALILIIGFFSLLYMNGVTYLNKYDVFAALLLCGFFAVAGFMLSVVSLATAICDKTSKVKSIICLVFGSILMTGIVFAVYIMCYRHIDYLTHIVEYWEYWSAVA